MEWPSVVVVNWEYRLVFSVRWLWFVCKHVYPHPTSVGMKTQPESKCPELLANYCDMLLRKTALSKKLNSEEIELKLKEVVSLCPVCLTFSKHGSTRFEVIQFQTTSVLPLFPTLNSSFNFAPCSSWCWSTSRIKMCSCVTTKPTWPGAWSWTFQQTVRSKRTWWSGWEWVSSDLSEQQSDFSI